MSEAAVATKEARVVPEDCVAALRALFLKHLKDDAERLTFRITPALSHAGLEQGRRGTVEESVEIFLHERCAPFTMGALRRRFVNGTEEVFVLSVLDRLRNATAYGQQMWGRTGVLKEVLRELESILPQESHEIPPVNGREDRREAVRLQAAIKNIADRLRGAKRDERTCQTSKSLPPQKPR